MKFRISPLIQGVLLVGLSAAGGTQAARAVNCDWCSVTFHQCVSGSITEAQKIACYDNYANCMEACGGPGIPSFHGAKSLEKPQFKMSPGIASSGILKGTHRTALSL